MQKIKSSLALRSGFTLVELSISIAFISVLAITITVLTINLINSYQRGITLKEVNSVGSELIDDLRSAITNSSAKSLSEVCETVYDNDSNSKKREACNSDHAYSFTYFVKTAKVTILSENNTVITVPIQGGFCSGNYSYLWNSGYFFNNTEYVVDNTESLSFFYKTENGYNSIENFRLLKILDPSRSVCVAATTGRNSLSSASSADYPSGNAIANSSIDISGFAALSETPTDLLSNSTSTSGDVSDTDDNYQSLALYNLYLDKTAEDSSSRNLLYTGSFILATVRGGINVQASGNYCATPENYTSDLNYCAINKFNFAARATGE